MEGKKNLVILNCNNPHNILPKQYKNIEINRKFGSFSTAISSSADIFYSRLGDHGVQGESRSRGEPRTRWEPPGPASSHLRVAEEAWAEPETAA